MLKRARSSVTRTPYQLFNEEGLHLAQCVSYWVKRLTLACYQSAMFKLLILFAISQAFSAAATVIFNWDITWVSASPDGVSRPVIGINGAWPCPAIDVNVGDRVVIHVNNKLGNESTSLHFHGLFQQGAVTMDGPSGVTQCPIPPGGTFTYDFKINQPGTYWYHSHNKGQYPDGLRGPILVHDPRDPHKGEYDEELVLTLSDWYHEQMPTLLQHYLSAANERAEPVPDSALLNDAQNIKLHVTPGRTYLVRIINMGAFGASFLHFDDHPMTIVEIDGIYTKPKTTDTIYLTSAQRYSVLIHAKPDASKNYAFIASMDEAMFDSVPPGVNLNVTGFLVYDDWKALPGPVVVDHFKPIDDFGLEPLDGQKMLGTPDTSITLELNFAAGADGINRASFNNITYISQKVPTLYTALSAGNLALDPLVYGINSNPFVIRHNQIVDIIANNPGPGNHPLHLHGHTVQVLERSPADAGLYPGVTSGFPDVPMRRDTVMVHAGGWLVLRFKADNPDMFNPSNLLAIKPLPHPENKTKN
ncbi:hypothetical protein FGG08_001239 [Glutinoglossum americanum]|uniref:Multicopper oxidase n=1 Tax=Glutinoglossum americanum TaxID=1670608 RepID=A0A9P8L5F4_9PEZI|nr:hypothetical protein FGG08_001239 [Glutinoglossum americanum]